LHGCYDPVSGNGIEQVMGVQLQYSYFPVREAEMKGRIEYVTLAPEQTIEIGTAKVTPFLLSHPVMDLGYLIENNGKSVFFTGDHEPPYNIYTPDDPQFDEYQVLVDEKTRATNRGLPAQSESSSEGELSPRQTPRTGISSQV